jgi:hypothetical protein
VEKAGGSNGDGTSMGKAPGNSIVRK